MELVDEFSSLSREEQLKTQLYFLKRVPIGFFSDAENGRDALEIHAELVRKVTGELKDLEQAICDDSSIL